MELKQIRMRQNKCMYVTCHMCWKDTQESASIWCTESEKFTKSRPRIDHLTIPISGRLLVSKTLIYIYLVYLYDIEHSLVLRGLNHIFWIIWGIVCSKPVSGSPSGSNSLIVSLKIGSLSWCGNPWPGCLKSSIISSSDENSLAELPAEA